MVLRWSYSEAGLNVHFAHATQAEASSQKVDATQRSASSKRGFSAWLLKDCSSRTCASKQGIIAPLMLWLSGKYILPKVLLSMIMALNDRHK